MNSSSQLYQFIIFPPGDGNDADVANFGQKFIGVEANSVLEIHGQSKIGWTKLTATLPKMPEAGHLFYSEVNCIFIVKIYTYNNTTASDRYNKRTRMMC